MYESTQPPTLTLLPTVGTNTVPEVAPETTSKGSRKTRSPENATAASCRVKPVRTASFTPSEKFVEVTTPLTQTYDAANGESHVVQLPWTPGTLNLSERMLWKVDESMGGGLGGGLGGGGLGRGGGGGLGGGGLGGGFGLGGGGEGGGGLGGGGLGGGGLGGGGLGGGGLGGVGGTGLGGGGLGGGGPGSGGLGGGLGGAGMAEHDVEAVAPAVHVPAAHVVHELWPLVLYVPLLQAYEYPLVMPLYGQE